MNHTKVYADISAYSEVLGASPHRQLALVFNKLQTDIQKASYCLVNQNIPEKCKAVSAAHQIVGFLQSLLPTDPNNFSEFDQVLSNIYAQIEQQLFLANSKNDAEALANCLTLSTHLKTWWDKIEH